MRVSGCSPHDYAGLAWPKSIFAERDMATLNRSWAFYAMLTAVTLACFPLHELAHWAMGEALGYDMAMSLNRTAPVVGVEPSIRDSALISAAGPLFTILVAALGFWWVRARDSRLAYTVVFAAWFERLAATFVSLFNPNDEARISLALGLGQWTLPLLVVIGLQALLWQANRRLNIGWKTNLALYLLSSVLVAVVVFGDAASPVRLI
jgi:hypothetical protein